MQYLAIRYTERLADEGAVTSVGSKGDSYDNALAESVNGLYKTELIRAQGPWRSVDQVELATAAWVAWWNAERLHGACGDIPPAEFEAAYHQLRATRGRVKSNQPSLHETQYGSEPMRRAFAIRRALPVARFSVEWPPPEREAGAVVDAQGRVHGVERLAVVDASIMPEAPSGFPHVITIMIAEHLSEMLGAIL